MAVTHSRAPRSCIYKSTRILIYVLSYLIMDSLMSMDMTKDKDHKQFFVGSQLSSPTVSLYRTTTRVSTSTPTTMSLSCGTKLIKVCRLLNYFTLASLILISGDVSPNPGWNCPIFEKPGLNIAHLNIRSLPRHLDELKILLLENPFDVLCLNETWLDQTWKDSELTIEGYDLIRQDRNSLKKGGGTAIYYKSKFNARQRHDLTIDELEAIWLEMTFPNMKKILISSVYRPPAALISDFIPLLENIFDRICMEGKEIIILGDFNCDLACKRLSSDTKTLKQFFSLYQFIQLIKDRTRITESSSTLIDLIFTTDTDKIINSGVSPCAISDHSLIYLTRRAKLPRENSKTIQYRNFKSYLPEKFIHDLQSASWDSVDSSLTVDDAWLTFKNTFIDIVDKHVPLCTKRVRAKTLPWLTRDIRQLIQRRNYHHKKAQKSCSSNDWSIYRALRNQVTSLIRNAKRNYYSDLLEENQKNPSKVWKILKSVISTNDKSNNIGSLEIDNEHLCQADKIATGFGKYFHSVINKLRLNLPTFVTKLNSQPTSQDPGLDFKLLLIDEEFVNNELFKLKLNKCTGFNNIPARLLKDGSRALAKPLTLLMNRTIAEGSIPSEWKHAIITPIHKSGSKMDPSNYRPISVLPVFSKILERAVHNMVYAHLHRHNLLTSRQSGFRPLHSTTTSLTHVTNNLLQNMDKGLLSGLVFLDLSKAFDTLDHNHMLEKLAKFGFDKSTLQWFRSYLCNRTQSVFVNGVTSESYPISFGVPQGSILGPLLFIMYINDLPSVVTCCHIELYADDTLLYFAAKSISLIEENLSRDMEAIMQWLSINSLLLNYDKTKIMLIGTHQRLNSINSFSIQLKDIVFDRVFTFKYLGVVMDSSLSWSDHVDHMVGKISRRLGMLRRARRVLPQKACLSLYKALVLPLFDYCACVWDSCGQGCKDQLDKLQNRAAKIIQGRDVSKSYVCPDIKLPSLQSRRDFSKCLMVFKCLNGLAPDYLLHDFKSSDTFHSYNTRNKSLLRLPLAKLSKYQGSFRYNGAKTWNNLPHNLREENDYHRFIIGLKNFF